MEEDIKKEEDLKFPMKFDKCPNCGGTKRIAGSILEQERKKGKIGKSLQGVIQQIQCVITDPRLVSLQAPAIIVFMDICADCGTFYCFLAQLGVATPGTQPGKGAGPRINLS